MFTYLSTNFYLGISFAHWLVLLSASLSLIGTFFYLHDMFRGNSKPNLVTWGLWWFAPMVATGAALSTHADPWATLRIFMSGFGPFLVFVTSFFIPQSYWKLSKLDYACGFLSLTALGSWLVADSPILAVLLAAMADLLAALPTFIKVWKYPQTENFYAYLIGLFTASLVIPAIPVWNIENSAFQIYLIICNTILFLLVLRGRLLKKYS